MPDVPELEWMHRWDQQPSQEEKDEIANMDVSDFETLLEEIEHR